MTAPIRPDGPVVSGLERNLGIRLPSSITDAGPGAAGVPSFGDVFTRALNDATGLQNDAQQMIGAFLRGEPVELHQVMAASEEAAISLELLVEIRNKLTDAYRSVMNMT